MFPSSGLHDHVLNLSSQVHNLSSCHARPAACSFHALFHKEQGNDEFTGTHKILRVAKRDWVCRGLKVRFQSAASNSNVVPGRQLTKDIQTWPAEEVARSQARPLWSLPDSLQGVQAASSLVRPSCTTEMDLDYRVCLARAAHSSYQAEIHKCYCHSSMGQLDYPQTSNISNDVQKSAEPRAWLPDVDLLMSREPQGAVSRSIKRRD